MLVKDGTTEVDVGRYMGRTALELIGQAIIGHSFDPLTEPHSHPYAEALKGFMCAFILPFYNYPWALTAERPVS